MILLVTGADVDALKLKVGFESKTPLAKGKALWAEEYEQKQYWSQS